MLRMLNALRGYSVQTKESDVAGTVYDFYFDDSSWTLRYMVVSTGTWLPGRRVLISPVAFGQPDWIRQTFPVHLTKDQIKGSPDVDTHKPISRQEEEKLASYYRWPVYWTGSIGTAGLPTPDITPFMEQEAQILAEKRQRVATAEKEKGSHLRSAGEVTGYTVQAKDGDIGHVDDFVVDDQEWVIRYLVEDMRKWLPGRKVLLSPMWVKEVRWSDNRIAVDLTRQEVEKSPPFDPSMPVNREYEIRLYDYYGRPKYWP